MKSSVVALCVAMVTAFAGFPSFAVEQDIFVSVCGEPDADPDRVWNTFPVNFANLTTNGLVDVSGAETTVGLRVRKPLASGVNAAATIPFVGEAAVFEAARAAGGDQYFAAATYVVDGYERTYDEASIEVTGLDPSLVYEFEFISSIANNDASKKYSTRYAVEGVTTASSVLEARNQSSRVARVTGIVPCADGTATISITASEDNNIVFKGGTKFFYLLAFRVHTVADLPTNRDVYVDVCGVPGADTKTWNALSFMTRGAVLQDLVDAQGRTTGIRLEVTEKAAGLDTTASVKFEGSAADFDAARQVGADNAVQVYGCTKEYTAQKLLAPVVKAELSGLVPGRDYVFSFVSQRKGAAENRDTKYQVEGATTAFGCQDIRFGYSNVVSFVTRARADGSATLSFSPGPDNKNGYGFFHLCAFRISFLSAPNIRVQSGPNGSVSTSGEFLLEPGDDSIGVTATPETGYRFFGWARRGGGEVLTANPLSLTSASANNSYTAVFVRDSDFTTTKAMVDVYGTPLATGWNYFEMQDMGLQDRLFTSEGLLSSVRLQMITDWRGFEKTVNVHASQELTGDAVDFEPARDNKSQLYFSYNVTSRSRFGTMLFKVTGLTPARPYTFRFMGSNTDVDYVQEGRYIVHGENAVSAYLVAKKNTTSPAVVRDVVARADGTVTVEMCLGRRQDTANKTIYLLAFSVEGELNAAPIGRSVLWYGNESFLSGCLSRRFVALAEAAGFDAPFVVDASAEGAGLAEHRETLAANPSGSVNNKSFLLGVSNGWTDAVMLGSLDEATRATGTAGGLANVGAVFFGDLRALSRAASVRGVVVEPWSAYSGNPAYYPTPYANQADMARELSIHSRELVKALSESFGSQASCRALVGTSYARTNFDESLYLMGSDLPSVKGSTLISLQVFKAIYGRSAFESLTYSAYCEATERHGLAVVSEADWNAVKDATRAQGFVLSFK